MKYSKLQEYSLFEQQDIEDDHITNDPFFSNPKLYEILFDCILNEWNSVIFPTGKFNIDYTANRREYKTLLYEIHFIKESISYWNNNLSLLGEIPYFEIKIFEIFETFRETNFYYGLKGFQLKLYQLRKNSDRRERDIFEGCCFFDKNNESILYYEGTILTNKDNVRINRTTVDLLKHTLSGKEVITKKVKNSGIF